MRQILIIIAGLLVSTSLVLAEETASIPTLVLHRGDAVRATIEINPAAGSYVIATLTPEKQAELTRFTKGNLGKKARLVVGEKVIVESVIREEVTGPVLQFPAESPEFALETVSILFGKSQK
jgi:preprotein translocase subunit SecD